MARSRSEELAGAKTHESEKPMTVRRSTVCSKKVQE